jgi:hypothetical protein
MTAKAKVLPMTTPEPEVERITGLTHYDKMRHELKLCSTTDEVKDIRQRARAAEIYAQQIQDREAERQLAEIRFRAERRLGELLKEMGGKGERDIGKGGDRKSRSHKGIVKSKTLSDIGITKKESARCQQLAAIPEEKFEKAITDPGRVPTIRSVLAARGRVHSVADVHKVAERKATNDLEHLIAKQVVEPAIQLKNAIRRWQEADGHLYGLPRWPAFHRELCQLVEQIEQFIGDKKPKHRQIKTIEVIQ